MKAFFPHHATTDGVTVRVAASFLPEQSELAKGRWFWAYHIRLENDGEAPVRLLSRRWQISDNDGQSYEVKGEGVVGEQPIIAPGESFDYVSGCPLETHRGAMAGSYVMQRADGSTFEAEIPRFELVGPAVIG